MGGTLVSGGTAHLEEVGGETGFFVGADGAGVDGVDVEAEFGNVSGEGPLAERFDEEGVDALAAMGGVDVHEAEVGVDAMAEVVAGGVDAGVGRPEERTIAFGDEQVDVGGGRRRWRV